MNQPNAAEFATSLHLRRTSWPRGSHGPAQVGQVLAVVIGNLGLTATQWRAAGG